MKKVLHILVLSCLEATKLIEKSKEGNLSFVQKMQLSVHKSMCKACCQYEKQSALLDKVLIGFDSSNSKEVDLVELKKNIIDEINQL